MRYCTRGYTNASARKITDDKGSGQPILEHTSLGDRRTAEKNKDTQWVSCPERTRESAFSAGYF